MKYLVLVFFIMFAACSQPVELKQDEYLFRFNTKFGTHWILTENLNELGDYLKDKSGNLKLVASTNSTFGEYELIRFKPELSYDVLHFNGKRYILNGAGNEIANTAHTGGKDLLIIL